MTENVKGPASYFPSIEKTYGQPVAHWLGLIATQEGRTHMQIVGWLKDMHGIGHGHANALVAYALAKKKGAAE
jgi:ribulose-5-phosphate 4-epimerase/fuculose-1-phosphate aldolase